MRHGAEAITRRKSREPNNDAPSLPQCVAIFEAHGRDSVDIKQPAVAPVVVFAPRPVDASVDLNGDQLTGQVEIDQSRPVSLQEDSLHLKLDAKAIKKLRKPFLRASGCATPGIHRFPHGVACFSAGQWW